jgi:5-methylcytosine-specific restriction endonuclease McrA
MVLEKATVLEFYEDWIVHSASWQTQVPAVMILREYEKRKATIRYSKQNVFLRDNYECQYCGDDVSKKTATLDHVLPVSHGGKTTFENTVTACGPCNAAKGNNKKIVPVKKPYKPNYFQLVEKRKNQKWDMQHPSWANYLE